jgi:GPI ethanolamine phosphate transferase 1
LFFCVFSLFLFVWLIVERRLADAEEAEDARKRVQQKLDQKFDEVTLRHARIAAIYVALCLLSFFGTGNVASVTSFELSSTYRFVTVFNPFLMAALLLVKLMIPFAILAAFFGLLNRILRLPPLGLSLLVTAIADVMTINFFFLVRDHGSWQDIGMSISYYVMANAFLVFHFLMSGLSAFLLRKVRQAKLKLE